MSSPKWVQQFRCWCVSAEVNLGWWGALHQGAGSSTCILQMLWVLRSFPSTLNAVVFPIKSEQQLLRWRGASTRQSSAVWAKRFLVPAHIYFYFFKTARQEKYHKCAWEDIVWCTSHSTHTQHLYASPLIYYVETAVWACRKRDLYGCLGQYPLQLHDLRVTMHATSCLIHNQPCRW